MFQLIKNIADLFTKCLSVQVRAVLEKEIRNIAQKTIGEPEKGVSN